MKKKLNERGLPSIGGVSPGDTSNNLGQARRPWNLTGSTGGHSQSADSGFSSRLGRVNKGRDDDKYAYPVRFPENEEESEHSVKPKRRRHGGGKSGHKEDSYDVKLRSKIALDLRGRKPMPEVRTLSYVLNTDIDDLIKENEERQALIDEDLIETDDGAEVEEHSIGGYTGPMASPANPKKFYKGMLKSYPGSHYVNDLPKSKA